MANKEIKKENVSSKRLMLLVTIVNRAKADYYADLIQSFSSNLQFLSMAEGTADLRTMSNLGIKDSERTVICSVIREDRQDEVLRTISERFNTIKDGNGIAFTLPFTSVIGAGLFNFLCDNRNTFM